MYQIIIIKMFIIMHQLVCVYVNAIDFATTKISDIIPKEVFKEFFISSGKGYKKDKTGKTLFRNSSDKDAFKAKVVAYYNNQLPIKLEEHQKQMEGKISLKSAKSTEKRSIVRRCYGIFP